MKRVKRTLSAVAVVALLTGATEALSSPISILTIPVYMNVDGEVDKCYLDCEEFEIRANFEAQLSLSIDVIDPEFKYWDFFFDGANTVPGDGSWHTLKACVWTYKQKQLLGDPGTKVLVSTISINVTPQTVSGVASKGYYIEIKNAGDHQFDLQQVQCWIFYVDIDIKPETLNLKSKGVFTAFINLPEGYDGEDVDISTIECEGAPAVDAMMADNNKLIVKFDREDLVSVSPGDAVVFTVTGKFTNETPFVGSDTIRVIDKGGKK